MKYLLKHFAKIMKKENFLVKLIIGLVSFFMLIFSLVFIVTDYYLLDFSAAFPIIIWACVTVVIFQIVKKDKKWFNWVSIIVGSCIAFSLTIITLFTIVFSTDQIARMAAMQNEIQQPKLIKYNEIFDYLEKYKKENSVYPDKIDKSIVDVQSEEFDKYVYKVSEDKKKYVVRIYTKDGPIKYYKHKSDYDDKIREMTYVLYSDKKSGMTIKCNRHDYEAAQKNKKLQKKQIDLESDTLDNTQFPSDYLESNLYKNFEPHTIYYEKEKE